MFGINKKAQAVTLGSLPRIALILTLVAMVGGAGALATQAFQDTTTAGTHAHNVTGDGLTALSNMSNQLGTVGTIVGVAVIIGVVIGAFAFFGRR